MPFSLLKFLTLTLLATWTIHAFAEDTPSKPGKVTVLAGECASSNMQSSYATPFTHESGNVLIARAPDLAPNARLCAQVVEPVKAELKLIAVDHVMGLAAYELPSGIRTFSDQGLNHLLYDSAQTPMGTLVRMTNSERHFLPTGFDTKFAYWEVIPRNGKSSEFFHAVGAPVGTATQLQLILSDQTVITLPGQPAKVFRERDLSRLAVTPFVYYRVGITPATISAWLKDVRAGKQPAISLLEPTKDGRTVWELLGHRLEENCFKAGEATGTDNVPVGGINPVGVGGLEDVLSSCRFSLQLGPKAVQIPNLSALLSSESTSRVFLAYRRTQDGLELKSIQNVQHLLQLLTSARARGIPAWSFLVEKDFLKASSDAALQELRTKAIIAKDASVLFFQNEFGDPMILRKAFVLATLLNSHEYSLVSAAEIEKLQAELATDLPDHLRELDIRGPGARSAFVKAKNELLVKFKALEEARKKLP